MRISYIAHFVLVAFWFEVDVYIGPTQHNGRLVIRPVNGAQREKGDRLLKIYLEIHDLNHV